MRKSQGRQVISKKEGRRTKDEGRKIFPLPSSILFRTFICALCLAPYALCQEASAEPVSSTELITNAKQYDGKTINYEGELIGSVLRRNEFSWLNLHDGNYAIGVLVKKEMSDTIKFAGNYDNIGDWVGVGGIFHRACIEHGGALDIHVTDFKIIKQGEIVPEVLDSRKPLVLVVLFGVFACLLIVHILRQRRLRK